MAILPHTNEKKMMKKKIKEKREENKLKKKKRKKRREVEEFQIEHFLLVDIMAVKGLMKDFFFLMLLPSHHNDEKSGCDSYLSLQPLGKVTVYNAATSS